MAKTSESTKTPEATSGAKKFVANWRIEGITKKPLEAGDPVELSEEDAKDLVAAGALSPVRARAEAKTEGGEQ